MKNVLNTYSVFSLKIQSLGQSITRKLQAAGTRIVLVYSHFVAGFENLKTFRKIGL